MKRASLALFTLFVASATGQVCSSALAASAHRSRVDAPTWITWNAASHTATLKLVAAYTNAVNGFNFNGYGKGAMVITVPAGAKVKVTFSNNGTVPHSAMVVAYSARSSAGPFKPVFAGASSSNPTSGITKGKVDHFTFTARKAGKYALVCAVPGHAPAGMWDVFKVVAGGKASVSIRK